jgi:outer membrane receptor protein involved in Fe transport
LGAGAALAQAAPPAAPEAKAVPPECVGVADVAECEADAMNRVIIVTGSRLVTQSLAAQPPVVVTGQNLENYGYTNIGQALTQLPQFGVPGNSTAGPQGSFGAGQTFVNLYDLGSQRTLTLVNGNRFISSATSSFFGAVQGSPVDLGEIAPDLVDHIDVVSVGGAPIYGSDAIAGTVNVILKKNYEGFTASGSTGISGQGDAGDQNISLLAGKNFADGRGNITASFYYDHQDGLPTSARSAIGGNKIFNGSDPTGTYSYARFAGGLHYSVFTNTGMPLIADDIPIYNGSPAAAVTNAAGQALFFNGAGHLVPFKDGTVLGNGITEAGGDGFPIDDYGNFLTNSERIQGTLLGHYDISDHVRFHGEFWLSRNTATNVADQPYYSTALFAGAGQPNGNLILSTSNPFLSAADQATIRANLDAAGLPDDTFYMARANTDLETGSFTSRSTTWRVVAGLDGDFTAGSHNFTWDATFNYGHVSTDTKQRELVTQNFYNALDAVLDPSGNITCAPGYTNATIATYSSTCAPLDIFGNGHASQAALNYITAPAQTHQVNTQLDIVADLKGDVARLPGGTIRFALGYEHRRESQSFDPGAFYRGELQPDGTYVQYGNSIPIVPVAGSYHTDEGFGELQIPVVSPDMGISFIHSLDLNAAARFTQNSITGGFWSYTGGGSLAPVEGLVFRGNYTRSFRSPSVTELFAPESQVFDTGNDPCDHRFLTSGPNPAVRAANCAAAGLPADFQSNIVDFTAEGTGAGTPTLKNEKGDSWTAGVVIAPKVVPGLKLTGDYVSIDITNEIREATITALMDACYDSPSYPNDPACNTFTRDASGQVVDFQENFLNIAIERFRAFQTTLSYALPLSKLGLSEGAGTLNFSANWLHTFDHYYKLGDTDIQHVVTQYTDPTDAVQGNIDWATKRFDWLWQITYYGPSKVDPNTAAGTYQYPNVDPYWMVNTSIGIKANDHFNIRLIIDNIFDLGIPFPNTDYSSNKYYDAIMGRYFRLNAQVKF